MSAYDVERTCRTGVNAGCRPDRGTEPIAASVRPWKNDRVNPMRSSLSKLLLILSLAVGAQTLSSVALASTVPSVQARRHHPRRRAHHRERRREPHHEERVQDNRGEL